MDRPSRAIIVTAALVLLACTAHADPFSISAPAPSEPRDTEADRGGSGEDCSTAFIIPSLPFSTSGTTAARSDNYNDPCPPGTLGGAPDVVYRFIPPYDMTVDISLCSGTAFDSVLYVYRSFCTSDSIVDCNDDFCGLQSRIPALALSAGFTYYILIDGFRFDEWGAYTLDIVELHGATDLRCDGSAAFANEASPPQFPDWTFGVSDLDFPFGPITRFESFSFTTSLTEISHLTFWGAMFVDASATPCAAPEYPVRFNVHFFADAAGLPGAPLCTYDDVLIYPSTADAAKYLTGGPVIQALRFDLDLAALPGGPCLLPDAGWVSIVSFGGDAECLFWWLSSGSNGAGSSLRIQSPDGTFNESFDLSLCLQGAPPFTCAGDADGNGVVNTDDITFVILRLGNVCP